MTACSRPPARRRTAYHTRERMRSAPSGTRCSVARPTRRSARRSHSCAATAAFSGGASAGPVTTESRGTCAARTCCGSATGESARSCPTSRGEPPAGRCVWMARMSDSDSIDAPSDIQDQPEHPAELDPAIAEAVDGVTNRFGAEGLEQMIAYGEKALAQARAALDELADSVD